MATRKFNTMQTTQVLRQELKIYRDLELVLPM